MLPWILCGILLLFALISAIKIYLMHKSMDQICTEIENILSTDTNILISVGTGDKHIRRLAAQLNYQLRLLREQRHRYLNGDKELKTAVTNIAHDLRTPLTAISGYLDLLEGEEKNETVVRYLSFIENRTKTLIALTEELFRYTVILSTEELKLEEYDIRMVLEESLLAYNGAMKEKDIIPEILLTDKPVRCMVNCPALSRVFSNIINNAIKYSDGDLRVELKNNGEIVFSNTASNLDEVQVGRLFDRFYTVEDAHNSTGLGLSIAKALTEQMEGKIKAEYINGALYIYLSFDVIYPNQ